MEVMIWIWFDMDGTIGDFYGVPGCIEMIRAEDSTPYEIAAPLVDMSRLARAIHKLQAQGVKAGINSWGANYATPAFDEEVAEVKCDWLDERIPSVNWDEILITHYGVPKQKCKKEGYINILFDDNPNIRQEWGEYAYAPEQIFEVLNALAKGNLL